MKNNQLQRIKEIYNLAVHGEVTPMDLDGMSLHAKCSAIYEVVDALRQKLPQSKYGTARHTRDALSVIVDSFSASDALIHLQDQRRSYFTSAMNSNDYSYHRDVIGNWQDIEDDALLETTILDISKLHAKTYLLGMADVIPTKYAFTNTPPDMLKLNIRNLGGFTGNLKENRGTIRLEKGGEAQFRNPAFILNTVHHETTHAIQFALASAFHHGQIRHDHLLYDDARMFHALEVNKAIVPSGLIKETERHAYEHQVHEVLANSEGEALSAILLDLSR